MARKVATKTKATIAVHPVLLWAAAVLLMSGWHPVQSRPAMARHARHQRALKLKACSSSHLHRKKHAVASYATQMPRVSGFAPILHRVTKSKAVAVVSVATGHAANGHSVTAHAVTNHGVTNHSATARIDQPAVTSRLVLGLHVEIVLLANVRLGIARAKSVLLKTDQSVVNVPNVPPVATDPLATVHHVAISLTVIVHHAATDLSVTAHHVAISLMAIVSHAEIVLNVANVLSVRHAVTARLVIARPVASAVNAANDHLVTSHAVANLAADVRMASLVLVSRAVNVPKAAHAANSMVMGLEANPAAKVLARDPAASLQVAKG